MTQLLKLDALPADLPDEFGMEIDKCDYQRSNNEERRAVQSGFAALERELRQRGYEINIWFDPMTYKYRAHFRRQRNCAPTHN